MGGRLNMACCCQVASVMSDSVRPHRWQPTRLPHPWDSPGKNTGMGCHFLLQCLKAKSESEVAQSCPTLSDPMDCSLPGLLHPWSGLPFSSPSPMKTMVSTSFRFSGSSGGFYIVLEIARRIFLE